MLKVIAGLLVIFGMATLTLTLLALVWAAVFGWGPPFGDHWIWVVVRYGAGAVASSFVVGLFFKFLSDLDEEARKP